MNKEEIEKLLTSIGALAEVTVLFYKTALRSGATKEEAAILTKIMLSAMKDKGEIK